MKVFSLYCRKNLFKYGNPYVLKFNFGTNNNLNQSEIKEKLNKEKVVKIYDAKYTFNSEKLLAHGSIIFLMISTHTIFFSNVSFLLKTINFVVLFTPSLLIQIERLINNTRFVRIIHLLPENKIKLTKVFGKTEVIDIQDLCKADHDPRVQKQTDYLNNETFIIFTNKNNRALYHLPRDGIFLNEDFVHNILEGKKL